ncbi:MAG: TolC family protein [Thermodesulfobacteriota bacterium]
MKTTWRRHIAAVLLALFSGGCGQPDRWSSFEKVDYGDVPLKHEEMVAVPADLQPRPAAAGEGPLALPDGGVLELGVEQAIVFALRNNRDLRVQQLSPVITGTFEAIERGVYDPELFADLEYARQEGSDTDRFDALDSDAEEGYAATLGVRRQLPTGTSVEAAVEQSRSDDFSDPTEQTARAGISITQSLLRGLGPAVNLVNIRQAELETAISVHELRGVIEALLADTEIAYWEYVLAGQKIEIVERSLAIARQQLDEIEQRIEVGTLPRIEAAAAHAQVARHEQALIDAHSALTASRLRLLRLINADEGRGLDLEIRALSGPAITPMPIDDLADRLQLAGQARSDLAEARLRLRQHRLETIATRNGLLPRLDLFIALGKTGYAESFSDSFRNLDDSTVDLTAGIRLSQRLGNRQAEALDLAARASRQQAAEAVANLEQIVALDVRLAVNEAERARQQIDATRATRTLQEKVLEAEQARFEVGASTALLVAQAQRDLVASSIDEVEAVVNYRKALAALYLVEGSLPERRGVGFGK